MLYCMVLVPWSEMAPWIDWLDKMAPEWDFAYAGSPHIEKNGFSATLLMQYKEGMKNNDRCAHMRVSMTEGHMLLHKLAWNVHNIAKTPETLRG